MTETARVGKLASNAEGFVSDFDGKTIQQGSWIVLRDFKKLLEFNSLLKFLFCLELKNKFLMVLEQLPKKPKVLWNNKRTSPENIKKIQMKKLSESLHNVDDSPI